MLPRVARRPTIVAIGAAALLLPAAPAAAALGGGTPTVVDTFSTTQSALTLTFPPAGTTASSSVSGGGILGGHRNIEVALNGGVIASNQLSAVVSSGFFSYSQDATITGTGTLTWDGASTSTVNPTGLGGVDLTAGGSQDALYLGVVFDDLPVNVTLTVWSDAGRSSRATITLPGLIFSTTPYVLPYSSFTPFSGGGADFSDVGAIRLEVGSAVTAPDLVLDEISTDARLRAPMTASLSIDANGNGQADPGDEITYAAVISNPDDALNADSPGTAFTLDPPAGTALIVGSVTTTAGTVTSGNASGDTAVDVDVGTVADAASVTVTARVEVGVHPPDPISAQGTVSSSSLTALPTDDPAAAGNADPTLVAAVENRPPVAADDQATVVGGQALDQPAPGVLANDDDADGDPLTATVDQGPAHGQLTLDADGSFRYVPDDGFVGSDAFRYVANDGYDDSAPATVTITVTAPPIDPPIDPPAGPAPTPTPSVATPAPSVPAPGAPAPPAAPPAAVCVSRRTARFRLPRNARNVRSAQIRIGNGRWRTISVRQGRVTADLRGLPRGTYAVRVRVGKRTVATRSYRTCQPGSAAPR